MNAQEILTRVIDAMTPYKAIEAANDSRDVNPWTVAGDMHKRLEALRADLEGQIRLQYAVNAGSGSVAKALRAFLKSVAKDARESLRYPWIDSEGRECYCDGYRAFRLNEPLRLVDRPDNAGHTIDLARIYPDSLDGWKELPMPTVGEIKAHIALQAANGTKRHAVIWSFGPGLPAVSANYLLDAAQVFPNADRLFWISLVKPLVIRADNGDGLILPIRVQGNAQAAPTSDDERKAAEAYSAKEEANRQAAAAEVEAKIRENDAIRKAHDREEDAAKAMRDAAGRCDVLRQGIANAANNILRGGLRDQLADAEREFAMAALKRHEAQLEYNPNAAMEQGTFEMIVKMLYGAHNAA